MGLTLTGESLKMTFSDPRLRSRRRATAGGGVVADTATLRTIEAGNDEAPEVGDTPPTGGAAEEGDNR